MRDREEVFHHRPSAVLTVGDLRRVLEGVPDEVPLKVATADEPGGDAIEDRRVVSNAEREEVDWEDGFGRPHHDDYFVLSCDYPEGDYFRPVVGDDV